MLQKDNLCNYQYLYCVYIYWLVLLLYTFVISESFLKQNYIFSWQKLQQLFLLFSVTKLILPEQTNYIITYYIQTVI